jgi:hypothetical protein
MAAPVDVDREPFRIAVEIEEVGSRRVLPAEVEAIEPAAPERALQSNTSGRLIARRGVLARSFATREPYISAV